MSDNRGNASIALLTRSSEVINSPNNSISEFNGVVKSNISLKFLSMYHPLNTNPALTGSAGFTTKLPVACVEVVIFEIDTGLNTSVSNGNPSWYLVLRPQANTCPVELKAAECNPPKMISEIKSFSFKLNLDVMSVGIVF